MHRLGRRAALLAAPALLTGRGIQAQEVWPSRPVTLIVPWAPGGSNDVAARLLAPALEARFGQPFVVEIGPAAAAASAWGRRYGPGRMARRCSSPPPPTTSSTR
ncbi:hypothetical protein [Dankookia sp. P2]|uniref:hypothetical protein n=1 Tax=Dankookia sp. P2 TaxID=3423955 RepID=UPI003D674AF1